MMAAVLGIVSNILVNDTSWMDTCDAFPGPFAPEQYAQRDRVCAVIKFFNDTFPPLFGPMEDILIAPVTAAIRTLQFCLLVIVTVLWLIIYFAVWIYSRHGYVMEVTVFVQTLTELWSLTMSLFGQAE